MTAKQKDITNRHEKDTPIKKYLVIVEVTIYREPYRIQDLEMLIDAFNDVNGDSMTCIEQNIKEE